MLSIVIPTHNRSLELLRCITSILYDDRDDFHVYVSDNCSEDATPDVLTSLSDPRLTHWRNDTNVGADYNILGLFDRVKDGFVLCLTDDSWLEPGAIDDCVRLTTEFPQVGGIITPFRGHNESSGEVFYDGGPSDENLNRQRVLVRAGAPALRHLFPACNAFQRQILRRDCVDLAGFRRQIEKRALYAQMWLAGSAMCRADFLYVPRVLVNVVVNNKAYWDYPEDYGVLPHLTMTHDLTEREDLREVREFLIKETIADLPSRFRHARNVSPHRLAALLNALWRDDFLRQRDDFRDVMRRAGARIPE